MKLGSMCCAITWGLTSCSLVTTHTDVEHDGPSVNRSDNDADSGASDCLDAGDGRWCITHTFDSTLPQLAFVHAYRQELWVGHGRRDVERISHFDGAEWASFEPGLPTREIHVAAADDFWAVNDGQLWRSDELQTWRLQKLPSVEPELQRVDSIGGDEGQLWMFACDEQHCNRLFRSEGDLWLEELNTPFIGPRPAPSIPCQGERDDWWLSTNDTDPDSGDPVGRVFRKRGVNSSWESVDGVYGMGVSILCGGGSVWSIVYYHTARFWTGSEWMDYPIDTEFVELTPTPRPGVAWMTAKDVGKSSTSDRTGLWRLEGTEADSALTEELESWLLANGLRLGRVVVSDDDAVYLFSGPYVLQLIADTAE